MDHGNARMTRPTIFILAGGNDRTTDGYGARLNDEITTHIAHPKILSCFFSLPEPEWPAKYQDWKEWFSIMFGSDLVYDYAKKETFFQQVDTVDVIYLHGGDTQLLFNSLSDISELKSHFKGKMIVGSSAGSNVLSKNYWSSMRAVPGHGLDIVDANIMVHYGSLNHEGKVRMPEDWIKEEAEFQEFIGAGGKITRLPNGEFIVVEKYN